MKHIAGVAESIKQRETGWTSGFYSRQGHDMFLYSTAVLGHTESPVRRTPASISPEVKRPGHETNHSPTSSVNVKNAWYYTSTSLIPRRLGQLYPFYLLYYV
jgi:hypothetical protein